MATALSLFPARVRFVTAEGILTPEGFRALTTLFERAVAGESSVLGGDVLGGGYESESGDVLALETVSQPAMPEAWFADVMQPVIDKTNGAPETQVVGASPWSFTAKRDGLVVVNGGTVSAQAYGRNGSFTSFSAAASVIPILAGDVVRITYTVAPTVTFIPR